jgi:hypothetical protein
MLFLFSWGPPPPKASKKFGRISYFPRDLRAAQCLEGPGRWLLLSTLFVVFLSLRIIFKKAVSKGGSRSRKFKARKLVCKAWLSEAKESPQFRFAKVNQSVNYFVDGFSKKNPRGFFIWGQVEELLELKYIVSLYLHFAYVHAQLASHVYRNCLGIWPSRSSSV